MKKVLLALSLAFCIGGGIAQTTDLGGPVSSKSKLSVVANFINMPSYDKQLQAYEDSINDANKVGPWRFGYNHHVNLGLSNAGNWINLPNGDRVWRIGIKSKDALSMNLIFDDFFMPQGAYVHVFNPDFSSINGAYASHNNNIENTLGTELVEGDKIIVEYFEPAAVQGQGRLNIGTVTHGYRKLSIYTQQLIKALNSSGDCNIDVLCPLGLGWENQINSVAMIVSGGNGICTGALINNTCEDGTPYFLTANHCLGGSTMSWVFRFNWDSPVASCATTSPSQDPGTPYNEVNGATLRANDGGSDFALLELSSTPTGNIYYSGWDRTGTPATQATGIHHPSGDVKKICRENNSLTQQMWGGAQTWQIADWDQGVTEPGSSGSPLFDQNGRIVGQLYGGSAACSGTNDNNAPDYYGCFHVSWTGAGTNATRLSNWLDPGCGSTITQLDGYDPNQPTLPNDAGISGVSSPVGTICGATVTPEFTLKNYGTNNLTAVTITYDFDGVSPSTMNWTGNLAPNATQVITLAASSPGNGAHTFNVLTSNPNGTADSDPSNDNGASTFNLLVNGQQIDFNIETDCWGSETSWTLEDAGSNLIATGGPYSDGQPNGGGSFSASYCLDVACYTFTITDSYGDGMYGSQYGSCNVDGYYNFTNANGDTLIELIATNSDYGSSESQQLCITAANLNADFMFSSDTICEGESVDLLDNSSGNPTNWSWVINGGMPNSANTQNVMGVTFSAAGTYNITLDVDDGTTTSTVTKTIVVNSLPGISLSATDITCFGSNDGSATAIATGASPFTYLWSTNDVVASVMNLSSGVHTVVVTDANGCASTGSITVLEPNELLITNVNVTNASCGSADGSLNISAAGGTGAYQYSSDNGMNFSPNSLISNLSAGSYIIVVEDQNGCQTSDTVVVGNPNAPIISGSITNETCDGDCDGEIDLTVSGGTAPYAYSWCNGQTTEDIINICPTTCEVTVTDANNCIAVSNFTVLPGLGYPTINPTANEDTVYLSTGASVSFMANITGGTVISWDFGDGNSSVTTNPTYSYGSSGTYQVILTASNGPCQLTDTLSITVLDVDAVQEYENSSWSIYPNPTEKVLNIQLNSILGNTTLDILSMDGKLVHTQNISALNTVVNLNNWAKGTYIIRLRNQYSITHKSMVIK